MAKVIEQEGEWTPDWPTEAGMYWLWGRVWGDKEPRLYHTEVNVNNSGHPIYVCKGHFLFKGDAKGEVRWLKINPPKTPALSAESPSEE